MAIGIVEEAAVTKDRPDEFGDVGAQWDVDGWYVKVDWLLLENPFRPKDSIDEIAPLLPERYSPIRDSGDGNQAI